MPQDQVSHLQTPAVGFRFSSMENPDMSKLNLHFMQTEMVADQQLVRFSCPICERCVESGPDGLRILVRGDTSVRHQGGSVVMGAEVDAERERPTLH